MPTIQTPFGTLDVLSDPEFFPDGSPRWCIVEGAHSLVTPLGTLVPQFTANALRKRQLPVISFHQNGMIRNLPLEEQAWVSTPLTTTQPRTPSVPWPWAERTGSLPEPQKVRMPAPCCSPRWKLPRVMRSSHKPPQAQAAQKVKTPASLAEQGCLWKMRMYERLVRHLSPRKTDQIASSPDSPVRMRSCPSRRWP